MMEPEGGQRGVKRRISAVYEQELGIHVKEELAAVRLIAIVGELQHARGIELVLCRRGLINYTASEVLRRHDYCRRVVKKPIDVFSTCEIAYGISEMELHRAKIDIGKLCYEWVEAGKPALASFLREKLASFCSSDQYVEPSPRDVVLYGFGRIGRIMARLLVMATGSGQQLRLRAIVTRDKKPEDILKRAALFVNDSVHGQFEGSCQVSVEQQHLVINGNIVKMISSPDPESIDYNKYGIKNALVIDNTGVFTDKESLSRHLASKGVERVLLTAPGKGCKNIVHGINEKTIDMEKDTVLSAASCTTNAISPVLKVIHDTYGIKKGHVESVHSYTNDQNLLDNYHKKARRGRAAAINMVPTSTGAATAVPRIIPELTGKLTASSVRVPTPNVSLAVLQLELNSSVTRNSILECLRAASVDGPLCKQIFYSDEEELVSSDVKGNPHCSVLDSVATIVHPDGKSVVLKVFYDNEYSFSCQVRRIAKLITGVRRHTYY